MNKCLFFFILLCVVLASAAHADFYTWEDETGAVHITDYPPPPNTKQKVQVHKRDTPALENSAVADKKTADITLFTRNDCPDCDKAKGFLKSKNLPYTEYNMDTDDSAAALRKNFDDLDDVPFAVINRVQVYGFSEAVYNRALNLKP